MAQLESGSQTCTTLKGKMPCTLKFNEMRTTRVEERSIIRGGNGSIETWSWMPEHPTT